MKRVSISRMLCGAALAVASLTLLVSGSWVSAIYSPVEAREDHAEQDDHSGHVHDEGKAAGSSEADGNAQGSHGDPQDPDHGEEAKQTPDDKSSPDAEGHEDHEGHQDDDGHNGHDEHDEHDDHGSVDLTPDQMDAFDVRTATVSGGPISVTIERPAEVVYDENALAHVVPRVAGIARTINAAEGDEVAEGEVLAVLESRELADAKATYLASLERLALAKENFARADALIDKRIVSAKVHLEAKTDYAEARISLRNARQKLFALGIGESRLNEIAEEDEADLTEYVMRAPLSGTVVARHLTRGESVPTDREAFVIADVSSVWVDISIYAHDLEQVEAGQSVTVVTESRLETEGKIAFVTPNVSEETRTANARVFMANKPMRLRPGMFVTARIAMIEDPAEVRVPAAALQNHEGRDVVFVKDKEGGFNPRPVTLGRRNSHYVEVLAGLRKGDTIVTDGAFIVKSQLAKSGFDDGHNH
jgi:cobalt-zinc-cadmium efflux system membrane fusion protein